MILLDTSGLFAALNPRERLHEPCRDALLAAAPPLLLSPFVLAELDYLTLSVLGVDAELELLQEIGGGAYELTQFSTSDVQRAHDVALAHRDLEVGVADASLVVLSGRTGSTDLLTLDERHFRTLTGAGGSPFRLHPSDM